MIHGKLRVSTIAIDVPVAIIDFIQWKIVDLPFVFWKLPKPLWKCTALENVVTAKRMKMATMKPIKKILCVRGDDAPSGWFEVATFLFGSPCSNWRQRRNDMTAILDC